MDTGTSFEELCGLLIPHTITDYKLDDLYRRDREYFFEYLSGFIIKATLEASEDFVTPLDYESVEVEVDSDVGLIKANRKYFTHKLLPLEKLILVNYMAIYWYEKTMEDIIAISSKIGNRSEKDNNDKNDINKKSERINQLRRENYANIRKLQLGNLSKFEWWGDQ